MGLSLWCSEFLLSETNPMVKGWAGCKLNCQLVLVICEQQTCSSVCQRWNWKVWKTHLLVDLKKTKIFSLYSLLTTNSVVSSNFCTSTIVIYIVHLWSPYQLEVLNIIIYIILSYCCIGITCVSSHQSKFFTNRANISNIQVAYWHCIPGSVDEL